MGGKKYIFLTNSLGGISGGPSYVNNKKQWLQSQGWTVSAFDGYDTFLNPIKYQGLIEYKHNRIKELRYHPSWFNNKKEGVLKKMLSLVNLEKDDLVVVESHTQVLAEWAELLAKKIKGKHIIFLIGEHVRIVDDETYNFYLFKYKRNELFTINSKAFSNLFKGFLQVVDADDHYWNAKSLSSVEDYETKLFDDLPDHDYVITQFGRWKEYFPAILPEINNFVKTHKDKMFLFLIIGEGYQKTKIKKMFKEKNIIIRFYKSITPIPQKIFDISDVVIATAGNAKIAYLSGSVTISMDVESHIPLGVVGYTTTSFTYKNINENNTSSLFEILNDILIKKKKLDCPKLNLLDEPHGYEYQLSQVVNTDEQYYDEPLSDVAYSRKQSLYKFLVKTIGLVKCPIYIDFFLSKYF